jgi:hypothetical protein
MESQVSDADRGWPADYLRKQVQAAPNDIAVLIAEGRSSDEVLSVAALILKPGTDFGMLIAGYTLPA